MGGSQDDRGPDRRGVARWRALVVVAPAPVAIWPLRPGHGNGATAPSQEAASQPESSRRGHGTSSTTADPNPLERPGRAGTAAAVIGGNCRPDRRSS